MNAAEFNDFTEIVIARVRQNLIKKGAEYGSKDDRFYNFKQGARMRPKPLTEYMSQPIDALLGMQLKHDVSVYDLNTGNLEATDDVMLEKFGDLIAYHILNMGLLKEMRDCCACEKREEATYDDSDLESLGIPEGITPTSVVLTRKGEVAFNG